MNKKYIINDNLEIQSIIKKSNKIVDKYFIIYRVSKKNDYSRYCISQSKKFGKANVRNLYKRRIKDILMKNSFESNYDYVIILRNAVLEIPYGMIKDKLIYLLKGDKNE